MKKASKALYCVMLTTIILCACIVPCFAIEVTVEAEGWNDLGFTRSIQANAPTDYTTAETEGYFSLAQTEVIIELAEQMYKANAFNGARPVLITLTRSEYGYYVLFWCNEFSLQLPSYNQLYAVKVQNQETNVLGFQISTDYNVQSLQPYNIYTNGSVRRSAISNAVPVNVSPYYDVDTDTTRNLKASWYYAYYNGSEWVYDESDPFCACNNSDTADYGTAVNEFQYALDQWKNANKGTTNVNTGPTTEVQYQLDIPAIITAIPNAAKQIINNAFGFEIFGINVAGLLSVLLVVTIVAFVVKWLMSR